MFMADKKKLVLHYGGATFDLPESQHDALKDLGDEMGTLKLNLGEGKWLTIVHGPGIPIALAESVERPARVRVARVL
jgi:hypothetical protein